MSRVNTLSWFKPSNSSVVENLLKPISLQTISSGPSKMGPKKYDLLYWWIKAAWPPEALTRTERGTSGGVTQERDKTPKKEDEERGGTVRWLSPVVSHYIKKQLFFKNCYRVRESGGAMVLISSVKEDDGFTSGAEWWHWDLFMTSIENRLCCQKDKKYMGFQVRS